MSKSRRAGHKAKRGHENAAALLAAVADALTACGKAGMDVRLHHDTVETRHGYVLPVGRQRWAARTKIFTEFSRTSPKSGRSS